MTHRALVLALVLAAFVAAAPAGSGPVRTIAASIVHPFALVVGRDGVVYVGNSPSQSSDIPRENNVFPEHVTVYAPGSSVVKRTVVVGHEATALMLDASQHLYVLEYGNTVDSDPGVTEFASGSEKVVRRIPLEGSDSEAFALDGRGNLYVANVSSFGAENTYSVRVYRPGATSPSRTIAGDGSALGAMATDDENLYLAAYDDSKRYACVCVYSLASGALVRKVTDGIRHPVGLAVDRSGKLYVANAAPPASVAVYARGGARRLRTISTGISSPSAIALSPSGELYVANDPENAPGSIAVFSPGSSRPELTLSAGVNDPADLGFDRSGNLYVANRAQHSESGSGSVTVYRATTIESPQTK